MTRYNTSYIKEFNYESSNHWCRFLRAANIGLRQFPLHCEHVSSNHARGLDLHLLLCEDLPYSRFGRSFVLLAYCTRDLSDVRETTRAKEEYYRAAIESGHFSS